ncbi:flagellar filament capping protein FliD [Colwellia sp. 1_MG-2023]|uniref:flagellar filament capping protein FliD n=1 Tax=Colwellia sp. 1_MG-2023 TaxID=3062649 RepID=UPI0026E452BB|nr:flagellar filament capping protein FliD [Colwellia sp. 1_MG-2023]MDO6444398.1 flagellar filament capping protein FliD [Colwellia sp. 1_MG-2023]
MALITSAGVGSGLDLESIISATVDAENLPKLQKFTQKESELSVNLSSVGAIKSSLSSLDDIMEKLADIENFNKRTATLTQPSSGDLISVTTTSESTSASFNVEVIDLAQGSRAVMDDNLFTSPTDEVTASGGNLTFTAGAKSFSLNLAAGATLEELRVAINDSDDNFGVTANIINDGTSSKLVLTSDETGNGNDLVITNDTAELDNVSTLANDGVSQGGLKIALDDMAQDAVIEVDGISISSATNKFTDAIQDITITALKESENNEKAGLVIDVDKETVESNINEFIEKFNNVIDTIEYHTKVGGALSGDSSMRSLKSQLVNTLSSMVTGAGGFETLYDIGLGLSKKGDLEKDSLVRSLNDALTESYDDVGTIFTAPDGIATVFSDLLDNYLESDGALIFRENSLNAELKQLENDRSNHDYRMEQLEITLRKKYSSLDVLIAQMQSNGSFLTSQLANLPGFTRES